MGRPADSTDLQLSVSQGSEVANEKEADEPFGFILKNQSIQNIMGESPEPQLFKECKTTLFFSYNRTLRNDGERQLSKRTHTGGTRRYPPLVRGQLLLPDRWAPGTSDSLSSLSISEIKSRTDLAVYSS